MYSDVKAVVKACEVCQKAKTPREHLPGLLHPMPIRVRPFDRIAMDIVEIGFTSENGYSYILVISDYCTRFFEVYPLKHQSAEEVGTCVIDYICRYGAPRHLLSDRGAQFLSEVVASICEVFRIHKQNTTAYHGHPQTDGLVETVL